MKIYMQQGKTQLFKSIVSIVLILAMLVGFFITGRNNEMAAAEPVSEEALNTEEIPENVVQKAMRKLEEQKGVDETLRAELESGSYTFEEPLVVLDPYGESPLTALILFDTEEPSKIKITIPGEDEDTEAVHTFSEVSTRHVIPVIGLYADTVNQITLEQISEKNEVLKETMIEIETEPIPEHLDNLIIMTEYYGGDYAEGMNVDYVHKFAFDKYGEIRWYRNDILGGAYPAEYEVPNHHIIQPEGSFFEGDVVFYETDQLGKIYNVFYAPYGVHHDVAQLPNGNLLATGSQGTTIEDMIYEIDATTGEVVHIMDFKKILQRTRTGSMNLLNNPDWLHINSVVYDEKDSSIIVSGNFQSTVLKISWPDGEIKWMLADPVAYMPKWQKYLLEPVGEGFEYPYNQHDASILPDYDNNPDTIDILLFDNGWTRFYDQQDNTEEKYSRLVHYRINEKDMTVEQIWQYGKERGWELFADSRGSAQLVANGNVFGCFDKTLDKADVMADFSNPNLVEVTKDSDLIWDAEIFTKNSTSGKLRTYRYIRLPFYYEDSREYDIYIDGNNRIPLEVIERLQ